MRRTALQSTYLAGTCSVEACTNYCKLDGGRSFGNVTKSYDESMRALYIEPENVSVFLAELHKFQMQ